MKYLIDTQILIWFELASNDLKPHIYDILIDEQNEIFVAQISLLEIAIKQKIGKLPDLSWNTDAIVNQLLIDNIQLLPLRNTHIAAYSKVPLLAHHRDPFDRLLLASALAENLTVISADKHFREYMPHIRLVEA